MLLELKSRFLTLFVILIMLKNYPLEAYKGINGVSLYMKQLNNKTVQDEIFSYLSTDNTLFMMFMDQDYPDSEDFYKK
ncbi:hypothetical protein HMPREF0397_2098 [Fusobacterium nucleatum subsp. nucleatum ATCC 23726]|uniref:Uncharacterized protein n=2 Tax=Fusobacterium nucleatum TaxID=851 RepID=D5RFW3_FUSN2|nr:hypothetical protein HMPREF0397_2098 [Fusobacterium nucleatum subsp. nucleatum ATCC 23726]